LISTKRWKNGRCWEKIFTKAGEVTAQPLKAGEIKPTKHTTAA
jgi:hypothetical protein